MAEALETALLRAARDILKPGERVLLAFSGGADSVALLHILLDLSREGHISLRCAHYEHGIRGESSVADMRFCQTLCEEWGVPLSIGRGDVPAESALRQTGLEETARDMRHAFLETERRRLDADVIALAHHCDDQAETVLMRLMRGTSPEGAAGMQPRCGRLVRPFLRFRKRDLISYLEERGLDWREDETNRCADSIRNALRLQVLPAMESIRPGTVSAIGRYAAVQAEESAYMDAVAQRWLCDSALAYAYGTLLNLADMPAGAILSRALKVLAGKDAQYADIDSLRALCGRESGYPIAWESRGVHALRVPEGLWLMRKPVLTVMPKDGLALPAQGVVSLDGLGALDIEPCDPVPVRDDPNCQVVDADALSGARLRFPKPGDRLCPLGLGGKTRLLSDMCQEARVPLPARPYLPLIENGGTICWAVGLRLAESGKLHPGSRALRLRWRPCPPKRYDWSTCDAGI